MPTATMIQRTLAIGTGDPRPWQIAALSTLLLYGLLALDLEVRPWPALTMLCTCLLTQALGTQYLRWRLGHQAIAFDPRSAMITGLSLSLLLRTQDLRLAAAAALVAVASKFLLRIGGKHLFNPANLGLVTLMLLSDRVWASPGQWGSGALLATLFAGLGLLVLNRSARTDISLFFLLAYGVALFLRAAWLGDPWAIPQRQMANGTLLLFAFFMLSDPKTTPDRRAGRLLYAVAVAWSAVLL